MLETFERLGIRDVEYSTKLAVAFPVTYSDGSKGYHYQVKKEGKEHWKHQSGGIASEAVFALEIIPPNTDLLIITESPMDATILITLGFNAISVLGCGNAKALKHFRKQIPQCKIFVWVEPDAPNFAQQVVEALKRTVYAIKPTEGTPKDAYRILKGHGWNISVAIETIKALLDHAELIPYEPPFNIVDADKIVTYVGNNEVNWLIEGLIPSPAIIGIYGEAGIGKSTFLKNLSVSVALGKAFAAKLPSERGIVVYINTENPDSVLRDKLTAMLDENEIQIAGKQLIFINYHTIDPDDDNAFINFIDEIDAHLLGRKPVLMIIDTLNDFLPVEDYNDEAEARKQISRVRQLRDTFGCTVIAVGHPPKSETSSRKRWRGSQARFDMVDIAVDLKQGNSENQLKWIVAKDRFGTLERELVFERDEDYGFVLLSDYDRLPENAKRIYDLLASVYPQTMKRKEIENQLDMSARTLNENLERLQRLGLIRRVARGVYQAVGQEKANKATDNPKGILPDEESGNQATLGNCPMLPNPPNLPDDVEKAAKADCLILPELPNLPKPDPTKCSHCGKEKIWVAGEWVYLDCDLEPDGEQSLPEGSPPLQSKQTLCPNNGENSPNSGGNSNSKNAMSLSDWSNHPSEIQDSRTLQPSSQTVSNSFYLNPSSHRPERMTSHYPDGSIILSWNSKFETFRPSDIEGWQSTESIPTAFIQLPTSSYSPPITIFLKIETTGLNPDSDRLLAVGISVLANSRIETEILRNNNDEPQLLQRTFERLTDIARRYPNAVLTGYNLLEFTLPFLIRRSQSHNLHSPFSFVIGEKGKRCVAATAGTLRSEPLDFPIIKTDLPLCIVDTLHLVCRYDYTTRQLRSYDLKSVAQCFGVSEPSRPTLSLEQIARTFFEDPENFERYIASELHECLWVFLKLFPPYHIIAQITNLPVEEVCVRSTAWVWEQILERHYGISPEPEPKRNYKGGLVVARKGLFPSCCKIDIASLYPTIMLAFRIHSKKDYDQVALSWLKTLTEERLKWKSIASECDERSPEKALADVIQRALKVLINSLYGFYGTCGYGFNDMEVAEKVAMIGRKNLTVMIAAVEDAGGTVVEADTDGIIVQTDDPQRILDAVQSVIPKPFKLELEFTNAVVFVSDEKNYIVIKPDGEVEVKGSKWRGRDKEAILTEFVPTYLKFYVTEGAEAAKKYADEVKREIASGKGWHWIVKRQRVSKNDKFLIESGFKEGEFAVYAFRDWKNKVVSKEPSQGYDIGYYLSWFDQTLNEVRGIIMSSRS